MCKKIVSILMAITLLILMIPMSSIGTIAENATIEITPTEKITLWEYVPDEGMHFGHTNAAVTLKVAYDDRAGGNGSYVAGSPAAGLNFALNVRPSDSSKYVADEAFNLWRTNASLFSKMNLAVNGIVYNRKYQTDNLKLQLVNAGLGYNTTHTTGDNTNGVTNQLKYSTPEGSYYTVNDTFAGVENATWDAPTMVIWFGSATYAASREAGTFTITTDSNVIVDQNESSLPFTITTPYAENVSGLTYALPGDEVTLSTEIELSNLKIVSGSTEVPYVDNGDGTYTFTMPNGIVDFKALPANPVSIEITPTESFKLWEYVPDEGVHFGHTNAAVTLSVAYDDRAGGNGSYVAGSPAANMNFALNVRPSDSSKYVADEAFNLWRTNASLFSKMNLAVNGIVYNRKYQTDNLKLQLVNAGLGYNTTLSTGENSNGVSNQLKFTTPGSAYYTVDETLTGNENATWDTPTMVLWFVANNFAASREAGTFTITTDSNVIIDQNDQDIRFKITTPYAENVSGSTYALPGDEVTLSAATAISDLRIVSGSDDIPYVDNGDGTYTFIMPEGIVDFKALPAGRTPIKLAPTESIKLWEYVPDEGVHFGHTNAAVTLKVAYDDRAGGNGSYVAGSPAANMNFALNVRPSDSSKYVADENFNLWRTNANLFSKMNLAVNGIVYNRKYQTDNLKLQLVNAGLGYNTTLSTGENSNGVSNQLKFTTPGSAYYTVDETLTGNENATWDTPTMVLWFVANNFAASREAGTFTITTDSNVIIDQNDKIIPFTITTPYAENATGLTYALPGDEVTLSSEVSISDLRIISGSDDVPYVDNGDGTFTFTMPEGIVDFKAVAADANGDAELDIRDLVRYEEYIAGADISVAHGSDTNGDNVINSEDFVNARRMLLGFNALPYGNNSLTLAPVNEHPGIPGEDAEYTFTCKSGNKVLTAEDVVITTNRNTVIVDGLNLTVPFKTRNGGQLVVTARSKTDPSLYGQYEMKFHIFTEKPTYDDDFSTFDAEKWSARNVTAEDGKAVLTLNSLDDSAYMDTSAFLNQSCGSFSASIKLTDATCAAKYAFWMRSPQGQIYIQNPNNYGSSHGEIDILEWNPTWKNSYSAALHWMGWAPGETQSNAKDGLNAPNIKNGYHTFSVVWTDDCIYYYFDGKVTLSIKGGIEQGIATGKMFTIFHLYPAVDEPWWGGTTEQEDLPLTMSVDWFKSYGFVK